ncbi:hypothetical protein NF867_01825 [Solitalea sp. MAHUQ-68]|uniref:Lipoprotein n=1 Tax=Solitalea agri TaxID=2953739 RepID=A0A9X2EYY8_9SPHI|nr:hypothetical protein [Solitalea agri]MCO4291602.1 hypothetical protein [Solitalea agri]
MKKVVIQNLLVITSILIVTSCSSDKIKEKINKTGDAAGQAIGEFSSGVKTGVEKSIQPKIEISERLKNNGIAFGKTSISGDTSGTDNVLTAYVIFNEKFNGFLIAKAFDSDSLEMGRVKVAVKGEKDDAKYVEFHFDKRTDISNDSRLLIE